MKVKIVSGSKYGKIFSSLFLLSLTLFAIFFLLVASGQRGGDTYFSNLYLALPITMAALLGLAALPIALVDVIKNRIMSVLGLVSIFYGLMILLFVVGEVAAPH